VERLDGCYGSWNDVAHRTGEPCAVEVDGGPSVATKCTIQNSKTCKVQRSNAPKNAPVARDLLLANLEHLAVI
jgi:hypothetical protein